MRLLLAEDERELSNALVAILKHNNYSVDVVYNGEDALSYLENGCYDGAILDIMMPKMDGISTLRCIRAKGNKTPVLILTAKSGIDDRVEGLDCGADDYLCKPFAAKELLARIRAITRRNTCAASSVLKYGNATLDCTIFELKAVGSVRLQNKEFQMLELMMTNPTRYISTEEFMKRIWGFDCDSDINVVWVNISNLRRRLKTIGANVRIRASRNQGYILEEVS